MVENNCLKTSFMVLLASFVIYWCVYTHFQFQCKSESLNLRVEMLTHEVQFLSNNYAYFLKEYFKSKESLKEFERPIEKVISKVIDTVRTDIAETKNLLSTIQSSILKETHSERYDFALETSGAEIESIGQTELVSSTFSYLFFGPFDIKHAPRLVIQPYLSPGECFAFKGSTGEVTIKLRHRIFVDAVGIDHITAEMSGSGSIKTAPNEFSVYGMQGTSDTKPFLYGTFVYDVEKKVASQLFKVENASAESVLYVSFKFHSNHGDEKYTCVYRTRIYGVLDKNRTNMQYV